MNDAYSLPEGKLTLQITNDIAPDDYFLVAARENPKRAFLFVSKKLGKHLPILPSTMLATQQALVAKIPTSAEPILFIGMAETATALARGVYQAWLNQHQDIESLYIDTTRYHLKDYERLNFEEQHSHAPSIGLHLPQGELAPLFFHAQTLVLIDDELSTGNTFINLIKRLQMRGLTFKEVIILSITDFSADYREHMKTALAPLKLSWHSLLQGKWHYQAERQIAPVTETAQGKSVNVIPHAFSARTGCQQALQWTKTQQETVKTWLQPKMRLLVLGTGEFMFAPYQLALLAQTLGADVRFCATTRSPIRLWGAIEKRDTHSDPYGEGIHNYLYNYAREAYDAVWLVSELSPNPALLSLAEQLDAQLITLTAEGNLANHTLY